MKRALMTFGYPLGLALYDKSKSHVEDTPKVMTPEDAKKAKTAKANSICQTFTLTKDEVSSGVAWFKANSDITFSDFVIQAYDEGCRDRDQFIEYAQSQNCASAIHANGKDGGQS